MKYHQHGLALDISSAQRIELPRRTMTPQIPPGLSGLATHSLGPRMPARRASPRIHASDFPQTSFTGGLALMQHHDMQRQQSAPESAPLSKNEEILALLEEWKNEPDELGAEWWAKFDEELKANRLNFPERELP